MKIQCSVCRGYQDVSISGEDLVKWDQSGKHVQDFFPHLSSGERELLISEICETCFDSMFEEDL